MKKLAALSLGVALFAATLTSAPQQAKADNPVLFFGAVVVGAAVAYHLLHPHGFHTLHWKHVRWCEANFKTYNRYTDMYYYKPGKQRRCNSPYN